MKAQGEGTVEFSTVVLLDIDGTLTDTTEVDAELYLRALDDVFGLRLDSADADWESYRHVTDSGILDGLMLRHRSRGARAEEVAALADRFYDLVRAEAAVRPERFRAVAGAPSLMGRLDRSAGWTAVVATGGFRRTAELKLGLAGLENATPVATASESMSRQEIFAMALEQGRLAAPGPIRPVLVGDGVWDARTAALLRVPFLGVGVGERATRLLDAGAEHVVADFSDVDATLDILRRLALDA